MFKFIEELCKVIRIINCLDNIGLPIVCFEPGEEVSSVFYAIGVSFVLTDIVARVIACAIARVHSTWFLVENVTICQIYTSLYSLCETENKTHHTIGW